MKVENKDNKGNPYHDEEGKFTSSDNVGNGGDESSVSLFSVNKLKNLVLGNKKSDYTEEKKKELDNFFEELFNVSFTDDDTYDEEKYKFKNIVKNLKDSDYVDTLSIYEDELDLNEVFKLSIDEQKQILNAKQLLSNKWKDKELEELDKLNKKSWHNLWINSVYPSDYLEKKDKIPLKKSYFEFDYTGPNKEEKLQQLAEFEQYGKQYQELKEKIDSKYADAENLVKKYENINSLYSEGRKNNALWAKNQMTSRKYYSDVANKVINKFKNESPGMLQSVIDYTGSFSSINNPLRGKDYAYSFENPNKKKEFIKRVKDMTTIIDESTYDKDIWVQRGVNQLTDGSIGMNIDYNTPLSKLQSLLGKKFKDHGFLSCGSSKGSGFDHKDIIMNIYCPKGSKMLYVPSISHYDTEDEMIIQRGYSYKISKVEKNNGKIYLDVDLIVGSDKDKYDDEKLKELVGLHFKN